MRIRLLAQVFNKLIALISADNVKRYCNVFANRCLIENSIAYKSK